MTEEVEHLDSELEKLLEEVRAGAAKLQEMKGTNVDKRHERVDHLNERIARGKQMLKGFALELRTVMQEAGKDAHETYDKKRQAHQEAIDKLAKDIDISNRALEKKELLADKQGRLVKKKQFDAGAAGGDEIIEQGKRVQESTMGALDRTEKLVSEMEGIGNDTNIALHQQTDQIKDTHTTVEETQAGISAAGKKVRDIARRLATDKMIVCLILFLILAIIGIIVVNSLGIVDGTNPDIDCALDFTQITSACREAEAEAEAEAAAGGGNNPAGDSGGGGGGGGGGAGGGGNMTFADTAADFVDTANETAADANSTARRSLLFVGWTMPLADARAVELGDEGHRAGGGGLDAAWGVFVGVCLMVGLVRGVRRRR